MPAVCFICLGNICRSPMAEAVLRHLVSARPDAAAWRIDSAGTGSWHVGSPPYHRTRDACRRHGVPIDHRGRQVRAEDFLAFDWLLAMDRQNLADLEALRPARSRARVSLLGAFDPAGTAEVPDPYFGDTDALFEAVFAQVERACRGFLAAQEGHAAQGAKT